MWTKLDHFWPRIFLTIQFTNLVRYNRYMPQIIQIVIFLIKSSTILLAFYFISFYYSVKSGLNSYDYQTSTQHIQFDSKKVCQVIFCNICCFCCRKMRHDNDNSRLLLLPGHPSQTANFLFKLVLNLKGKYRPKNNNNKWFFKLLGQSTFFWRQWFLIQ